ncbi:hypothetical protein MUK42_18341 [Musa troglodytarum]|uniref:Uncharacterized protein n=1 Tax=Musa troglodytarum TaxID=320322 RepID=A0A9E7HWL5_9LILI|nr:hypothetical protein MUK42_18341 [Musa troglodytarum]
MRPAAVVDQKRICLSTPIPSLLLPTSVPGRNLGGFGTSEAAWMISIQEKISKAPAESPSSAGLPAIGDLYVLQEGS